MFHVVATAINGAVFGAVGALTWWLALGNANALIVGAVAGALLGALVGLMGRAASRPGGVTEREAMHVSGGLLGMATVLAAGIGLVVWLVRALVA